MKSLYLSVAPVIRHAGQAIMQYYHTPGISVSNKLDGSYITDADRASHDIITAGLIQVLDIPVISEEGTTLDLEKKDKHALYWLIDPLDGTQSFVRKSGHFNPNIALMQDHKPIFGCIYDLQGDIIYSAQQGLGAFKEQNNMIIPISTGNIDSIHTHLITSDLTFHQDLYDILVQEFDVVTHECLYSAIKFCRIAENLGDIFAQKRTTHHRDTAAGEIIVTEAGLDVFACHDGQIVKGIPYHTLSTKNGPFLVAKKGLLKHDIIQSFLTGTTR